MFKRLIIFLIFLISIFFNSRVTAAGTIIINEIMYDLPGTDDKHEWIEIKNISSASVDLTDWKFFDGDGTTNHGLNEPPKNGGQGSLVIPVNGYAIFSGDAVTFLSDHPGFGGILIDTVMSLGNTSDVLKIINNEGAAIDEILYSKEMGAVGDGNSLERVNDYSNQFCVSQYLGGSAGLANVPNCFTQTPTPSPTGVGAMPSPTPPVADVGATPTRTPTSSPMNVGATPTPTPSPSQILNNQNLGGQVPTPPAGVVVSLNINEFIPNPDSSDEENEWIEIYNSGETEVNLSGWKLKDASEKEYNFKDERITAGGYLVLNRPQTKITINNDAETLSLISPKGDVVSQIQYSGGSQGGYSFARYAKNDWRWTNLLTPGKANEFSQENKKGAVLGESESNISPSPLPSSTPLSAEETFPFQKIIFIALGVGFVFSIAVLIFMKKFIL
jgi:hypothetical protein